MNKPWLSLIAALTGERVSTPPAWPVRKVHRLGDVCSRRSGDVVRCADRIGVERQHRWPAEKLA